MRAVFRRLRATATRDAPSCSSWKVRARFDITSMAFFEVVEALLKIRPTPLGNSDTSE
jgi:hypothetical protein